MADATVDARAAAEATAREATVAVRLATISPPMVVARDAARRPTFVATASAAVATILPAATPAIVDVVRPRVPSTILRRSPVAADVARLLARAAEADAADSTCPVETDRDAARVPVRDVARPLVMTVVARRRRIRTDAATDLRRRIDAADAVDRRRPIRVTDVTRGRHRATVVMDGTTRDRRRGATSSVST